MTDQMQLPPAHAFLACGQLQGRETNIARREMANVPGGLLVPIPRIAIAKLVVEAILDYLDD